MSVADATQAGLIQRIHDCLAELKRRYPDRVTREDKAVLPGTCIKTRDDTIVWIGDHFDLENWPVDDLPQIARTLAAVMHDLESVMRGPHAIRAECQERGHRLLWALCDTGEGIEVDHIITATGGSDVCVTRAFPGAIVVDGHRWDWSPHQTEAIDAWCQALHRTPLEEIP